MRAWVRMRHVYVEMRGVIPGPVLENLRLEYGPRLLTRVDGTEEMCNVLDAPQYAPELTVLAPSEAVWFYRARNGLTQVELGRRLGRISHQNVSAMELGTRPIGRSMARRLAKCFGVPVGRFLR